MGREGRVPPFVRRHRLLWRGAAKAITQLAGALGEKRSPHLHQQIGKSHFKNSAGDGAKLGAESEIGFLPPLLLVASISPERLRLLRGIARPPLRTQNL